MITYELTFLLNGDAELKNLKALISKQSGKVIKEDAWGEKTLSYPIKKLRSANFYNWTVELDQTKISDLKKELNFNENLLRYLLLKID